MTPTQRKGRKENKNPTALGLLLHNRLDRCGERAVKRSAVIQDSCVDQTTWSSRIVSPFVTKATPNASTARDSSQNIGSSRAIPGGTFASLTIAISRIATRIRDPQTRYTRFLWRF